MKQYADALEYYTLFAEIKDSIINAESKREVAELRTKYETEKKQQRIETLETENELKELKIAKSRYYTSSLILLIAIITGFGYLLFRQNRMKARQSNMELEQKLLRVQMNPHFIFNSISAIQNYIIQHEPMEASSYLSNFAKLMRLLLQNSKEELITLEVELETLTYYLDLQKLRLRDKMTYSISVDEQMETNEIGIPPMLAQPFIENSIEHGLLKKETSGKIEVVFSNSDNSLYVEIIDDGAGRQNETQLKQTGHMSLATQITNDRLKLLQRKYKGEASMEYFDLKDEKGEGIGTKVKITIPLIYLS